MPTTVLTRRPRLRICLVLLPVVCLSARLLPRAPADPPPARASARTDRYGDPLPARAIIRIGTSRLHHNAPVGFVAFAAEGRSVLAAGCTGLSETSVRYLRRWDARTGKLLHAFDVRPAGLMRLAADGRTLATVGGSHIILWDLEPLRVVRMWQGEFRGFLDRAAMDRGGKLLVTAGGQCPVRLWDTATGRQIRTLGNRYEHLRALACSGDGRRVAAALPDAVLVWDTRMGTRIWHDAADVADLHFSPDGKLLAGGDGRCGIVLWNVGSGRRVRTFTGCRQAVFGPVAFSPDGKRLAGGDAADGTIQLWDVATGKRQHRLRGNGFGITGALAFSPDGRVLASGGEDRRVRLWDTETGRERVPVREHERGVSGLAFAADNLTLASASWDATLRLWDARTGRELRRFPGNQRRTALTFAPDGRRLLANGSDLEVWDAVTGRRLPTPAGLDGWGVAASAGTAVLLWRPAPGHPGRPAAAPAPAVLRLWDAGTGRRRLERQIRNWPEEPVTALSPHGKWLAVVPDRLDAEPVSIWDLATGKEHLRFQATHVAGLAFSTGGLLAATGDGVQLWDVAACRRVAKYESEPYFFDAVAFSWDGRVLAASTGREVRLWELASGQQLAAFTGHADRVEALAFSPDGRCLASGSADSTILLWDVTGRFREGGWPPSAPSARDLARLWQALRSVRADDGYRAVWELAAAPAQAVPWIRKRLPPAVVVSERRLEALAAGLDATRFAVRQQAARELAALGPLAEPVLRRALPRAYSAEQRRRIEGLLAMLDDPMRSPERLRELRAVATLEYAATPAARELLRALARGAPGAWRTREARAAVGRLQGE